jgi:hypothetical protein
MDTASQRPSLLFQYYLLLLLLVHSIWLPGPTAFFQSVTSHQESHHQALFWNINILIVVLQNAQTQSHLRRHLWTVTMGPTNQLGDPIWTSHLERL